MRVKAEEKQEGEKVVVSVTLPVCVCVDGMIFVFFLLPSIPFFSKNFSLIS